MSDPTPEPISGQPDSRDLFTAPPPERHGMPVMAWGVAGVVLFAILAAVLFSTKHKPAGPVGPQPLDPYAASLAFSAVQMSESTSLSGGKSTFIDGHVKNTGPRTLTGATVQVLFQNDLQMPPQVETVPLTLIRTHEPYVDTQSLSATPLLPGQDREFRLIFETINSNWNQQIPEIRLTQATLQ